MEGTVYFVQAGKDGPLKIGWAQGNPMARIRSLQTGNPTPLELRASIPGDLTNEVAWHYAFRHLQIQGEWFRYEDELREAIASGKHPKLPSHVPLQPSTRRSELLQVRVAPELKEQLRAKGSMSIYVRRLIEEDLGLSNGDVGLGDSQAQAERVGATVPSGVPVAEPRPFDNPETMKKVDADPQKLSALEITALARKRWPHLPLVVAEKKVKNELG